MTATTSNFPHYREERITYFHGSCEVYTPAPDGGSYVEYAVCTHNHTSIDAAKECGQKLARKRAREINSRSE